MILRLIRINISTPPGPIANAGDSSWEAALRPDKTDYLYFLAKSNGEVVFTKTLKDHNKAKEKYISKRQRIKGGQKLSFYSILKGFMIKYIGLFTYG